MTKLTKEQLIEDLKASTQNASGMFEIGEETICELVALLTEPSAPVSVPDLKPVGFLFVSDDGAVAYSPAGLPMKGFNLIGPIYGDVNACRSAMLQAGNSPATPWIPVGERMPERDVDVQVYCADKKEQMVGYMERNEAEGWFRFASLPNGGGVYCKPTHWMPLPASPHFREIGNSSTNNCRENAKTSTNPASLNSNVTIDCWCRSCRPVTMNDMRFVVCPDCGNKRCPHANDHRNDCTGSNEPGQIGSAYQAAPKQEE